MTIELMEIVKNLRTLGNDVADVIDVEAKCAEGGLPRSIRESISLRLRKHGMGPFYSALTSPQGSLWQV